MTTCLFLSNQDSQGHSLSLLCFTFCRLSGCASPLPPLPFVSPIFTIGLDVLQLSFWWDVWYFEVAGWRRRGCIGYLLSSLTFSWWRVGTCCEGSWLRLWKSVLRNGDVLAEGFSVFIFVSFRCHFLGRTFLTSSSHSEFKLLFLIQDHFLEYITGLNVVRSSHEKSRVSLTALWRDIFKRHSSR